MYIICIYICIYIYVYRYMYIICIYIYTYMFTFWLFEVVNWKITISPVPFGFPTMPPNLPKLLAVVSHPEKKHFSFLSRKTFAVPRVIYIYICYFLSSVSYVARMYFQGSYEDVLKCAPCWSFLLVGWAEGHRVDYQMEDEWCKMRRLMWMKQNTSKVMRHWTIF